MIKLINLFLFIFLLGSCVWDPPPPYVFRVVNFKYQDDNKWFSFPTDTANFIHYSERIENFGRLMRENDSVFSTSIATDNSSIYAYIKIIIKGQDGGCKVKLLSIDSIEYLDGYPEEKNFAMKMNSKSCFLDFRKYFIDSNIEPINHCIKQDSFYSKGLECYSLKKLEQSVAYFDSAAKIETGGELLFRYEQYSALNRISYIKIRQNDFANALKYIDLAFAIEPQYLNYSNRHMLIRNEHLDEDYLVELKSYYKFNSIETHQLLIHANKAYALYRLNKIKEARKNFKIALELYENEKIVTILKGIDLYFDGEFQQAVSILSKLNDSDLNIIDYTYYFEIAKKKI